jgi:tRNA (adenine57-N1/adenine58-N1)-methyltransferase
VSDGHLFAEGERVLLVDRKDRRYLVRLKAGRSFQSHAGVVSHDALIGVCEGSEVEARTGKGDRLAKARYVVLRPTLADVVLNMPRSAQVIYPKDLGAILLAADIFPGARGLEAGVGSGALERYEVLERDVYEGIDHGGLDRVVLDVPEPWRVVPHAEAALLPGGILCCYLPSINQSEELRRALARSRFGLAETFELLRRTWHIEGRAVRPDLRMVGHTGFLTTARLLAGSSPAGAAG